MMDRTALTQAEAAFLLQPSLRSGGDALRAALLALIAQGRIAISESPDQKREIGIILGSDKGPSGLASHLRVVEETLRYRKGGGRLTRAEVFEALQSRFGSDFSGYVRDHVAPDIINLEHALREDSKWLGLIPRTKYYLTPRGEMAAARLRSAIASLDDLPVLLRNYPDQALQLAHSAGIMLVLSPLARRQLPRLRKLMEQRKEDAAPLVVSGGDTSVGGFEAHGWDQTADPFGLLDSVSAVGEVTSADSSNFTDGGDGGGGGD